MNSNTRRILASVSMGLVLVVVILAATRLHTRTSAAAERTARGEGAVSTTRQPRMLLDQFSGAFEAAAAQVNPSVVPVFSEQRVQSASPFGAPSDPLRQFFGDEFFKRFFGSPSDEGGGRTVHSLGSGVIISADGYILTNNHVVEGADVLTVVVEGGTRYPAEVVGTDPQSDVALLKIAAHDLNFAQLGNSDDVRVGQWVIAVGNPFQLMHTVTAGIISAEGRSSVGLADYEDFIQTDASVNPGNSGGALADLEGRVIAINTAISSPSGGNVGIGFAIPINMAKEVADQLRKSGKVTRGYLGILPQDLDQDLAGALRLEGTEGALVGDVTPGGPADRAELRRGDVIVQFKDVPVQNSVELRRLVAQQPPGTSVPVTVVRDGRERTLTVTLGQRPVQASTERAPRESGEEAPHRLGLAVQTLTPDLAARLGYQNQEGALVTDVTPGSTADEAGLRRGDLIQEVNRTAVRTADELERALASLHAGDSAALLVRRGENTFFVAIRAS